MRYRFLFAAAVLFLAAYGVSRRWPEGLAAASVVAACAGSGTVLAAGGLGGRRPDENRDGPRRGAGA